MEVLIIEHDDLIASVLADMLDDGGIEATIAADDLRALRLCRADPPHLVITGLNRRDEDMKGLRLVRRMRARWPWLGAIYLAALWPLKLREGALGLRERFLNKPVRMRSLVCMARELLPA